MFCNGLKSDENALSNVLEVETSIKSKDKSRKSDQKFCEGRVYVDIILSLDVF